MEQCDWKQRKWVTLSGGASIDRVGVLIGLKYIGSNSSVDGCVGGVVVLMAASAGRVDVDEGPGRGFGEFIRAAEDERRSEPVPSRSSGGFIRAGGDEWRLELVPGRGSGDFICAVEDERRLKPVPGCGSGDFIRAVEDEREFELVLDRSCECE
jgi:hypothetical protein